MWHLAEPTTITPYAWVDDAFTSQQMSELKRMSLTLPVEEGTIGRDKTRIDLDVRSAKVQVIYDNDSQFYSFFQNVTLLIQRFNNDFFQFDLTGIVRMQIVTYTAKEGGHYDWHIDTMIGSATQNHRKLSLIMLVSPTENFEGGDLNLRVAGTEENLKERMKVGTMIAFPSHTEHMVTPITKGIRQVLVLWVIGPKWR